LRSLPATLRESRNNKYFAVFSCRFFALEIGDLSSSQMSIFAVLQIAEADLADGYARQSQDL